MLTKVTQPMIDQTGAPAGGGGGAVYNAIINGSMQVWQRVELSYATNNNFGADKWMFAQPGSWSGFVTFTKGAAVSIANGLPRYFNTTHRCYAEAGAAASSGSMVNCLQRIEGYYWLPMHGRSMTLTFYVKSSVTGTYSVCLYNTTAGWNIVLPYTISVANTWEKKTLQIPTAPVTGTWNLTTGIGATLAFTLLAGSSNQTSATGWVNTGSPLAVTGHANPLGSTGGAFEFVAVQLEPGDTASPFETLTFAQELARCQRYFWKSFPQDTFLGPGRGAPGCVTFDMVTSALNVYGVNVQNPVPMRAAPSIVTYNPYQSDSNAGSFLQTTINECSVTGNTAASSEFGFTIHATSAPTTVPQRMAVHFHASADL